MKDTDLTRRRFLGSFSEIGLGASLLPGVLWAQVQQSGAQVVSREMLKGALVIAGLDFGEQDLEQILEGVNRNLQSFENTRNIQIPNDVSPPFHFSAIVPGMTVNRANAPFRMSSPEVTRPANLEEVAFWPVTNLAQLIRTRRVTSTELTEMYLVRLKRLGYRETLNCIVTLLEEHAFAQAKRADAEIKVGKYRGPLHGIPWGIKDLFTVKGYKTTWGSEIYKDQILDYDASVVEMLGQAGAVLVAKLTTAELAAGNDRWFGGQTRNPWNTNEGAGGSSAGSAAATAAGLVGFSLGTETDGSIIDPSSRCGVTGLRPTFGRVSRYGAMVLAWTLDRPGPMCRSAEDCALVMKAIARVDGRDPSVIDVPFNWNAKRDVRKLKIGYLREAFDEIADADIRRRNELLLEQVKSLGVTPIPLNVPDFGLDRSLINMNINIESGAFFDELIRSGKDHQIMDSARDIRLRSARLIPATEYLRFQRARMMAMMRLAEATQGIDAYFGPVKFYAKDNARAHDRSRALEFQNTAERHFALANLATYPALAVPCGFTDAGLPVAVTFFARPFGESDLLNFGKAFQDMTDFHLKHPDLQTLEFTHGSL